MEWICIERVMVEVDHALTTSANVITLKMAFQPLQLSISDFSLRKQTIDKT